MATIDKDMVTTCRDRVTIYIKIGRQGIRMVDNGSG